jgi:hypothetical protein
VRTEHNPIGGGMNADTGGYKVGLSDADRPMVAPARGMRPSRDSGERSETARVARDSVSAVHRFEPCIGACVRA